MATGGDFDLQDFLPYLLNQAAEATSRGFQASYRARHGLTRTQWRVMANLGRFGAMTARDICRISHIEKTKVSRAVAGMEAEGLLSRATSAEDRRAENLSLTEKGRTVFAEIGRQAIDFDADLRSRLGPERAARFDSILREIIALQSDSAPAEDN
ncbi:MAG: winged helix-turn-helix transcriptional regulator [Rhodobacterales bacterium]|nr:winged helix-turn-helix transcriptional regulator [Rhodobacterales bacterium]